MQSHQQRTDKIKTYSADNAATRAKPAELARLIPERVSECALYLGREAGAACSSQSTILAIGELLDETPQDDHDGSKIIAAAKIKTSCDSEKCVLKALQHNLGSDTVSRELAAAFKIEGPRDNQLLSNINIDNILRQFGNRFRTFFPYNFNMLNYASYSWRDGRVQNEPDTLATIRFPDLYARGFRSCGCVINSDKYQGGGKHWMALFAIANEVPPSSNQIPQLQSLPNSKQTPQLQSLPNSKQTPQLQSLPSEAPGEAQPGHSDARVEPPEATRQRWTVEFFNSSGNAPAPEFANWLVKTKAAMESMPECKNGAEIIRASTLRHQKSMSECGLYSIFYMWARLNGLPHQYFATNPIHDQLMFELRQHLFDDGKPHSEWDWQKYLASTPIKWEKN